METRPYLLHALSPLHAGTGQAVDVIDLPIARMKATGIPLVPGSSVKGVLRDALDPSNNAAAPMALDAHRAVFGPLNGNGENPTDHAGALMVNDARLLALPVRSFRGTFAWVTSPLLLDLALGDLGDALGPLALPTLPAGRVAVVASTDAATGSLNVHQGKLFLEDLDLPVAGDEATKAIVGDWAAKLAPHVAPRQSALFSRRFAVVDDDTMTFLWETATQIDTRVRLTSETRTVAKGALWIEESLPPETVLVGQFEADRSRRKGLTLHAGQVLDLALPEVRSLQFGGKASVGRGRCRLIPLTLPQRVAP